MAADGSGGGIPGQGRLQSFVDRIERLIEDKKAVTCDLAEVFGEAKGDGFDPKILRIVIRRRAQDPAKRMMEESLVDLYEAALEGRRPSKPAPPSRDDPEEPGLFDAGEPGEPDAPDAPGALAGGAGQAFRAPVPDQPHVAREKGKAAAQAGEPITANPYRAGDVNRIHWDEAWCAETGTDGMDIPAHLKPGQPPQGGPK